MKRILPYILLLSCFINANAQERQDSLLVDEVAHKTKQFRLNEYYTDTILVYYDTLINNFHSYKVTESISPFNQTLGNYGLAYLEYDFFSRPSGRDDFLYRHLKNYMHHAGNVLFVDTHVPFAEIKWTLGGPKKVAEQTFNVRYSQNVSKLFNIGLDLDIIHALGQYNYQKAHDRAFTLHSSYMGEKYRSFASWSINNFQVYENGGVTELGILADYETRDVPVNLGGVNEAKNFLKNMNFQLVQKYILGAKGSSEADSANLEKRSAVEGTFTHIMAFDKGSRYYEDQSLETGFYDTAFINTGRTFDSLYARVLTNTLRFDFSTSKTAKFQLGIGIGFMNELNVFSQIRPTHITENPADTINYNFSSNAVLGSLFSRIGDKFGWEANGKLYFSGLKAGDIELKGKMNKSFNSDDKASKIFARGGFYSTGPSWWMNNWGSNHFEWTNDFDKQLRIDIGGGYEYPGRKFTASLDYSLINNYFYFNTEAQASQHSGGLSVITARLTKNFSFWKFRFDNTVLLQQSSNTDILDLPLAAAKTAFYFDHEFYFKSTGGRLKTQLGFEAVYNTTYYSCAYMPSTGIYYNQKGQQTGNYPLINVFANIKLKRTRFFLAFEHVNHGLMGENYYASPFYPMNIRMFKYGLAWTFYD